MPQTNDVICKMGHDTLGGGNVLHQNMPFILIEFVPTRNIEDASANV